MACVWTKITQLCNQILKNSYPELIWQIIINSESTWEKSETALRMPPVPSIFRSIELHSGAFQAKAVFWLRRSLFRRFGHLRNGSKWVSQVREGTRWSMDTPSPRYSFIVIPLYRFINMLCIPSWILEPQLRVHQARLMNSSPTLADQHTILLAWSTGRMRLCFLIKALLNTHYIGIQIQA